MIGRKDKNSHSNIKSQKAWTWCKVSSRVDKQVSYIHLFKIHLNYMFIFMNESD